MTEILPKFLQYISTTSGFLTFVTVITAGYAGIWFLFLFESSTAKPSLAAQPNPQGQEEKSRKKNEGAKGEQKKAPRKGGRETAASKA